MNPWILRMLTEADAFKRKEREQWYQRPNGDLEVRKDIPNRFRPLKLGAHGAMGGITGGGVAHFLGKSKPKGAAIGAAVMGGLSQIENMVDRSRHLKRIKKYGLTPITPEKAATLKQQGKQVRWD